MILLSVTEAIYEYIQTVARIPGSCIMVVNELITHFCTYLNYDSNTS